MSENNQTEELEYLPPTKAKKRFVIDFLAIFIFCTGLMILYQVMLMLDDFPPLFNGADIVYHISVNILAIISQFASSIATGIIFYYFLEFYNAKKKMRELIKIRGILYYILYSHIDILRHTTPFNELNRNTKFLEFPSIYTTFDIPYLISGYNKYIECDIEEFKKELIDHFKEIGKKQAIYKFQSFDKNIKELYSHREFSCFKGFMEDVESLYLSYDGLLECVELYLQDDEFRFISDNIGDYILFFKESIILFSRLEKFIESIDKKRVFKFMKMIQ